MYYSRLRMTPAPAIRWLCTGLLLGLTGSVLAASMDSPEGINFFEKKIRPLLVERCYKCHSHEGEKIKGGLTLDTRDGLLKGGDTGPALVPGDVEQSLLIKAVRYKDKDFQMPPKEKLSDTQIADLEAWVKQGAPDPRVAEPKSTKRTIDIAKGKQFWAYQLPREQALPKVKDASWVQGDIDRFTLAQMEARGVRPVESADKATLLRRAYYDLIGLPPTPEQIDAFVNDTSPDAFARVVDQLLASPHFGERWGRHWLDVARYAESMTLRGFVFKQAWRYRDYVVETFNQDRPFDRFVREQISGDLMPYANLAEHQRQLVGTAFLAMGNNNLEEQDKKQLRMDAVDEQLDTIGKAFLAQTIGCARCHDHKFDPIPTRDYYALAGILRDTKTLEHANVSKWLELPMPLSPDESSVYGEREKAITEMEAKIKETKKTVAKLGGSSRKKAGAAPNDILAATDLLGVVVDDSQAKKVGDWKESKAVKHYVGAGYVHDDSEGKGQKTITYLPELPKAGKYEVRFSYTIGSNRCTDVPVTVFSADGEVTIRVDEKEPPPIDDRFISLGRYKFELNGQGFVIVSNEGTKGCVTADAVQFIPVELLDNPLAAATNEVKTTTAPAAPKPSALAQKATDELKDYEKQLKQLKESGPQRPVVMSVKEEETIEDTQVHIRGSVHNLGDKVPRGFLQVATYGNAPAVPATQSGRLELGEWLTSPENPLTSRVMANRVWHWLMGEGIVRTTDNFGTTGEAPSHPELLDYLAVRFMKEGWSVKKLVREVMLSHTYQLSSQARAGTVATASNQADPDNHLFWHANRRRLEAECLRDTVLSVSGELKLEIGGSAVPTNLNADYGYKNTDTRRSLYVPAFRNTPLEMLEAFDVADPSVVTGHRNVSTVAPQALYLLNHPFIIEQAQTAAKRALKETGLDDKARIEKAYRTALGRLPSDGELNVALKFVSQNTATAAEAVRLEAWTLFYQTLFASVDFRYLN